MGPVIVRVLNDSVQLLQQNVDRYQDRTFGRRLKTFPMLSTPIIHFQPAFTLSFARRMRVILLS